MFRFENTPARTMQHQLDLELPANDALAIEIVEPEAIVHFCDQRISLCDARWTECEAFAA